MKWFQCGSSGIFSVLRSNFSATAVTILSLLGSDYQPSSQQSVTDKVCVPITSQTYKLVLPPELPEVTCVLLGCLASSHQAPGAGCMVQFYVV